MNQLALAALLLLAVASAIAFIYDQNPLLRDDLLKALFSSLLQLAALGIVGVYIKYLFDRHQEDRKRSESERQKQRQDFEASMERERLQRQVADQARKQLLARLGKAEDSLLKARVSVSAKTSLPAYDEMAREVTDAQIQVVYLQEEVIDAPDLFSDSEAILESLEKVARYLEALVFEYEEHRKRIEGATPSDLDSLFRNLPIVGDLIKFGPRYRDEMAGPYRAAARAVRAGLESQSESRQVS